MPDVPDESGEPDTPEKPNESDKPDAPEMPKESDDVKSQPLKTDDDADKENVQEAQNVTTGGMKRDWHQGDCVTPKRPRTLCPPSSWSASWSAPCTCDYCPQDVRRTARSSGLRPRTAEAEVQAEEEEVADGDTQDVDSLNMPFAALTIINVDGDDDSQAQDTLAVDVNADSQAQDSLEFDVNADSQVMNMSADTLPNTQAGI